MARFLISPGVITREVDNSQYAATTAGLGNTAALVGYAEKGPFEPTLVTGQQNFVEKFGKTIADAPYLAQAAYKYFEENDSLLVIRAGNNQDPEAYPNAAQYSSISVRVDPLPTDEKPGIQAFSTTENLSPGTFSPGATYGFRVLSDFRAFKTPKYLEVWNGVAVETANTAGQPAPYTSIYNTVFKAAFSSASALSFEANYKRKHIAGSTAEYSGTGTKTGTSFGNTVSATMYKYRDGDNYVEVDNDYITLSGTHAANVMGSESLVSGHEFHLNQENFKVAFGATQYTVTLTNDAADIDAVVTEINSKLAVADNGTGTEDLTDRLQAVAVKQTDTLHYVMLKKIGGSGEGFTLTAGDANDALAIFGWEAGVYEDAKGIVGTWHAETEISGAAVTFDGILSYNLTRSEADALSFEEYINVDVVAPSAGEWSLADIESQIQSTLDTAYDGTNTDDGLDYPHPEARGTVSVTMDGKITISAADTAVTNKASIVRIEQPGGGNSIITLLSGVDSPVDGAYSSYSAPGEMIYTIKAKEKGSYGQKLMLRTETKRVTLGSQQQTYYNVYVFLDGYEVSMYQKVNWEDPLDPNFILTRMAQDKYIEIETEDEDEDGKYAILPNGDWRLGQGEIPEGVTIQQAEIIGFEVGSNGWTDEDGIITSMSADFKNALMKVYNPEVYDFNLIAAPGSADPIVQNAIQDLCESRKDCFGVLDAAEYGLGFGIKEGLNDITQVTSAVGTVTSSYVGAFWPWLQDYDADNQQYVWLPPSIYALKSMVYTDSVADPWFAPAGTTRGRVSALDVEYSPSRSDRDLLYGDNNIVNPIVFFVGEGITIWGQKTGQRTKSATDRINVRRLLIYAEKLIARMARGFLFEPNDSANWAAFTRQANAILEPIRQRRGLYQYTVICDESTNTADLINQNIMAGKIFVQPTKTTEFIEVEFTVNAAGDVTVTE